MLVKGALGHLATKKFIEDKGMENTYIHSFGWDVILHPYYNSQWVSYDGRISKPWRRHEISQSYIQIPNNVLGPVPFIAVLN